MKKILIIGLFVIISVFTAKSQEYTTSLGLRAGYSNGVSIKHFISEIVALEGILSMDYLGNDFSITGLYEIQYSAFDLDGLSWYMGAGAGLGSTTKDFPFTLSVDGIIGIEYKIPNIPLNVSLDFKPYLTFFGNVGLFPDTGISARYIFN